MIYRSSTHNYTNQTCVRVGRVSIRIFTVPTVGHIHTHIRSRTTSLIDYRDSREGGTGSLTSTASRRRQFVPLRATPSIDKVRDYFRWVEGNPRWRCTSEAGLQWQCGDGWPTTRRSVGSAGCHLTVAVQTVDFQGTTAPWVSRPGTRAGCAQNQVLVTTLVPTPYSIAEKCCTAELLALTDHAVIMHLHMVELVSIGMLLMGFS